jgi:hypothetical protein
MEMKTKWRRLEDRERVMVSLDGAFLFRRHASHFDGSPTHFDLQGVQKFRNFAKLKLVETPQTPISLKSSIHEVSEYT